MEIPDFLKTKPVFLLMRPFAIVQYGPPRSGSTLVYNILTELFPGKKIFKVHMLRKMCSVLNTVGTYRNPLDSIASSLLVHGIDHPSDDDVKRHVSTFISSGFNQITQTLESQNTVMLKYEDFMCDYNVIFNAIEGLFSIDVTENKRSSLKEKYGIKAVERKIEDLNGFAETDKKTKLHGNHISKHKGQGGYYKEVFSDRQIQIILNEFGETMEKLGYDVSIS